MSSGRTARTDGELLNWNRVVESIQQSDCDICRAIVLGQDGETLLLLASQSGFLLPSVEIPRWQRHTESFTAAMRSEWGCEVICLFTPGVPAATDHSNGHHYQVMECWQQAGTHHPQTVWRPVSSLTQDSFSDEKDYLATLQSLEECKAHRLGAAPGPFAEPGWFAELRDWVGETIGPLGLQLKSTFRQLNAAPSFSLIRFDTDGPAIWFKAVGEPNEKEFPITLTLAHLFPNQVAPVLSTQPSWNGWLSPEVAGTNLGESQDIEHWRSAAGALARLQVESIGRQTAILESGARDLRLSVLPNIVAPFLDAMTQLMEQQSKVPPPALSRSELHRLEEQIQDALVFIQALEIPDTLGHRDLNPGNIIVRRGGCTFLDWAEACVAHPFFSFEYLLEHFRRAIGAPLSVETEFAASYVREWEAVLPRARVEAALARTPLLAAFAYAAGSDLWCDRHRIRIPATPGYLRALTRRMNREAKQLTDRRTRWLS